MSEWREFMADVLELVCDAMEALPIEADSWRDIDLKQVGAFYDEYGEAIAEYASGDWPQPADENADFHQSVFEAVTWLDNIRLVIARDAPASPRNRGLVWQYIRKFRRTLTDLAA